MTILESYFAVMVIVQWLHSLEEISTHFEQRWPVWKMSRTFFVTLEILFVPVVLTFLLFKNIPLREVFMLSYIALMFANGIWHLMWAGIEKRYVPGLLTAPLFIVVFLLFYFQTLQPL